MHDRNTSRQLHSLAPPRYQFPHFVNHDGKLQTRPAEDFPLMIWPDGSWCAPANTYMRELLEKGLSRRNRGGTLAVAAANMSHLLRHCWKHRIDPVDLTDNDFTEFVTTLSTETRLRDPSRKRRDANSVIAIGRTCLSFLASVAQQSGDEKFVAPDGRIRATIREHVVKAGKRGKAARIVRYWDHAALPNPDPIRRRMPISTANMESIRKAVATASTTPHQRVRRHAMLKLLEVTGARRGEVALITIQSILEAESMEFPMLQVPTLKKRGGAHFRWVPINRADLGFLRQYVEVHRRSVVRRRLGGKPDHGILLVSEVTGEALRPNTITQEVRLLAAAAGITEKACPHMFRHRFLTKLFVALIQQYSIETVDQFRRMLLDGEEMKTKVAEWTDHADLESLERYIHLAFDEVTNFKKIYSLTNAGLALDSFLGILDAELDAIQDGEQPFMVIQRLKSHVTKLKEDISAAKAATSDDQTNESKLAA